MAKLQIAAKDVALITEYVQLAIQRVHNRRLNEAGHTKLFPDGKLHLLTDDDFIAQISQVKATRESKEI